MDYLLTLLNGNPATGMYVIHVLNHHEHINDKEDWGYTNNVKYQWNILNLIIYPIITTGNFIKGKNKFLKEKGNEIFQTRESREKVILFSFYILLLIIDPLQTIWYIILPNLVAQMIVVATNLLQHDVGNRDSEINHSVNFTNPILNWLTFNNGYHTIHHLYPELHWSLCPEHHKKYVKPHIDPKLDRESFLETMFKFYIWPGKRFLAENQIQE